MLQPLPTKYDINGAIALRSYGLRDCLGSLVITDFRGSIEIVQHQRFMFDWFSPSPLQYVIAESRNMDKAMYKKLRSFCRHLSFLNSPKK